MVAADPEVTGEGDEVVKNIKFAKNLANIYIYVK